MIEEFDLHRPLIAKVRTAVEQLEGLMLSDAWDGIPPERQRALAEVVQYVRADLPPIAGCGRYLLTVVGRKTPTPHTTPVSLVIDGSTRYLLGPFGEVAWVHNVRAAGVVTLARGGKSERFALADLLAPEAGPILERYLKLEPITRPYFAVSADAPADATEGEVARHPVFRLMPTIS
jgi:deazaflavin-dependent oxidoreductase (nitroreductase family)